MDDDKTILVIVAGSVIAAVMIFLLASMWYDKIMVKRRKDTVNFMYDKLNRFENED